MEYRHNSTPRPKKFKTMPSACKIFWLCLGLTKSLHDRIFGSWEDCQIGSVHWNNKNQGRGFVELRGQNRGFCCCMTMQDRKLLEQRLKLCRCWSLRFYPIHPTALTWHQAISISFLTSRRISRGLISPQMMKWSNMWRRGSNKELLNSSLTACVNLFYVGKFYWTTRRLYRKISTSICS